MIEGRGWKERDIKLCGTLNLSFQKTAIRELTFLRRILALGLIEPASYWTSAVTKETSPEIEAYSEETATLKSSCLISYTLY